MIEQKNMPRGIYLLPSLFTGANLGLGFISVLCAVDYNFTGASWAIMLAILMDAVDGRVARWTNATSRFGVEFDSLADLVSFGIAPAVLMYQMVLSSMHRPGVAIALFYVIAGALRLARFNVKSQDGESATHFSGLPIPAGAGVIASFVLSYELFMAGPEITVKTIPIIMQRMPFFFKAIPVLMILTAMLMISTVPYATFKKFKPNRPKSLYLVTLIFLGVLLILTYPQNTIFIIFMSYLLSGLAGYLWRYWRLRRSLIAAFKLRKKDGDRGNDCNEGTPHE